MDESDLGHHHQPRNLVAPYSLCFLIPSNGVGPHHNHRPSSPVKLEISDIEMISLQSATYTSLRDLLPASPPQSAIMSPTYNSSWNEIPIRNPLVKQAALAYLQPMSTPPEAGDKGLLGRLRERCGCLWWFRDAVLGALRDAFWGATAEADEDDEEEDDDEKVDRGIRAGVNSFDW